MATPTARTLATLLIFACLGSFAQALHAAPPKYRLTRLEPPEGWFFRQFPTITNSGVIAGNLFNENDIGHVFVYENGVVTDITPVPGDWSVRSTTINDAGHMVVNKDGDTFFLYADGQFTLLDLPGYLLRPLSMNNAGQITGDATQPNVASGRAFLYDAGGFTLLPTGPFIGTGGRDINDLGAITGGGSLSTGVGQPFLYENGATIALGSLGGDAAGGIAINKKGMVTGQATTAKGLGHAFRYSGGALKDLGTLGGPESIGWHLNASGNVVGDAQLPSGARRAFVYKNGKMKNLGAPGGGTVSEATYITNNGQVVGQVRGEPGFVNRVFVYGVDGDRTHDLNNLIDPSDPDKPFVTLMEGRGRTVNELGQIAAWGSDSRGGTFVYLVSPIDSTKPLITPRLEGILGLNGWYVSDIAVSWTVRDPQAPIASRSGCHDSSVTFDTGGEKFTCKATSIGGTRSTSVNVKRDTRRPVVSLARPAEDAVFERNQLVRARYDCSDLTSGIEICNGTVPSGSQIDTSKAVTGATFTVHARDAAGKTRLVTHTYSVK